MPGISSSVKLHGVSHSTIIKTVPRLLSTWHREKGINVNVIHLSHNDILINDGLWIGVVHSDDKGAKNFYYTLTSQLL